MANVNPTSVPKIGPAKLPSVRAALDQRAKIGLESVSPGLVCRTA
jgi:hypothetical protein